jgi:hypothetical protein
MMNLKSMSRAMVFSDKLMMADTNKVTLVSSSPHTLPEHNLLLDYETGYKTGKSESEQLLQEAATMLERYRDQLLVHSDSRPTTKEVNELLKRIYASIPK